MFCARVFLMAGMVLYTGLSLAVLPERAALVLSGAFAGGATVHVGHTWKTRNEPGACSAYLKSSSGERTPLVVLGAAAVALPATGYAGRKLYKLLPHVQLRVAKDLIAQSRAHVTKSFYVDEPCAGAYRALSMRVNRKELEEEHLEDENSYQAAFGDLKEGRNLLRQAEAILAKLRVDEWSEKYYADEFIKQDKDARELRATIRGRMRALKACPAYNGGKLILNSSLY